MGEELALRAIFVIVGLVFAGTGGFLLWRDKKLEKACTAQVSATVKEFYQSTRISKGR